MRPGIALGGRGSAPLALTAPSANERRGKLRSGSGAVLPAAGWGSLEGERFPAGPVSAGGGARGRGRPREVNA